MSHVKWNPNIPTKEASPIDLSERYSELEYRHPWETARCTFFLRLLRSLGVDQDPANWLDIGAGDAWIARQAIARLPPASQITCWDINYSAEDLTSEIAQKPGLRLVGDKPSGTFGGLMMLDVIEHIEDDFAFVREVVDTLMATDGWILVSVPTYQFLFTAHDTALQHYRRYSPRECGGLLRSAGLTIEAQGAMFHSLLAVRGIQTIKEKLTRPSTYQTGVGAWNGGTLTTRVATLALESETRLSLALAMKSKIAIPGLSFWAFCRRAERGGTDEQH
jgi:hypothetical protein